MPEPAPSVEPLLPSTPFSLPPLTPLPSKSASFVTLAERSICGIAVGIVIGVANAGGDFGGAATTLGVGGTIAALCTTGFFTGAGGSAVFSTGLGGSAVLTKFTFTGLSASSLVTPARAVAKTAKSTIPVWKTMLKTVPPVERFFWGLDSSSVFIMAGNSLG